MFSTSPIITEPCLTPLLCSCLANCSSLCSVLHTLQCTLSLGVATQGPSDWKSFNHRTFGHICGLTYGITNSRLWLRTMLYVHLGHFCAHLTQESAHLYLLHVGLTSPHHPGRTSLCPLRTLLQGSLAWAPCKASAAIAVLPPNPWYLEDLVSYLLNLTVCAWMPSVWDPNLAWNLEEKPTFSHYPLFGLVIKT